MARLDPHSYCDSDQPLIASFDLKARVDFERQLLSAEVALHLHPSAARDRGGAFDLDTRELSIHSVTDAAGNALPFALDAADPILGQRLEVQLPAKAELVRIAYTTSRRASALQWLTPEQTASGRYPYLFSQCQLLHARSVVPLQDTPRARVTYTATLDVPSELTSLMAAAFVERLNSDGGGAQPGRALDSWRMPEAIPPYLIAFAVGDVKSHELSPRVRIWAESPVLERAAFEFAEVEAMIGAAESLFGAYDWERFDLLVMPPSFPYGGMENPRLTFLTPTLLAGDRSLVSVVAHELAHSWTGNLVSNASAEHFWLNEGFTVYAERRIVEALEGQAVAELHAALGRRELERAVLDLADQPALTHLRTELSGVDPDEVFSVVPYEKGYLLLRALEGAVGRVCWDGFLKRYLQHFRFQSVTTDQFLDFLDQALPGVARQVGIFDYIDAAGIPSTAPEAPRRLRRIGSALWAQPKPECRNPGVVAYACA
jgi:leukotriene-A4 hydrolase